MTDSRNQLSMKATRAHLEQLSNAAKQLSTFLLTSEQEALAQASEQALIEARGVAGIAEMVTEPATREELIVCVEMLATSYPESVRSANAGGRDGLKLWWKNWKTGLDDVPADLIRLACRRWLQSNEAYMPRPGQLRAKIESKFKARKAEVERVRERVAHLEAAVKHLEAA